MNSITRFFTTFFAFFLKVVDYADTHNLNFAIRAGNSLIAHSLRSLKSNEQLWAIHSDRSSEMSDCERIAQVAHIKRATVSKLLRLLTKNEQCERIAQVAHQKWANERITRFFEQIAHSLIFSQKTSDSLSRWANSQPCLQSIIFANIQKFKIFPQTLLACSYCA